MGDVMEFDMGNGSGRGRPPPRIAARLASGRTSSGAKSSEGPLRARPPSGRADSKASDSSRAAADTAKRPSSVTTDSLGFRGRGGISADGGGGTRRGVPIRGRGSSDDEAAAKPSRRAGGSPPGSARDHRGSSSDASTSFRLGQKVEGRYRGKGRWYKGRIIGVQPGGTYDVRYDDGDVDLGLAGSAIKPAEGERLPSSDDSVLDSGNHRGRGGRAPRIGDKVEARVPGTTRWRPATVLGENRNGTFDVRFRNGDEERQLDVSLIRRKEDGDGSGGEERGGRSTATGVGGRRGSRYLVGDLIEAQYRGKSKWYKGEIRRANADGTFDIRYSDGDEERGVDIGLIRSLDDGSRNPGGSGARSDAGSPAQRGDDIGGGYRVGDKVEARFGGRARWFSATVERENRDGTYFLIYAGGDEERAVHKDLIRRRDGTTGARADGSRSGSKSPGRRVISGASSEADLSTANVTFRGGDKIEARYKRGRKWYPGVVRAVGRDGTYDIRYEDGDIENGVDTGLVRAVGVGSTDSLASTAEERRRIVDFREGDKVEARFKGQSRWSKATIQRENIDGTYHLFYIDGEEERAVEKDLIRPFGARAADTNGPVANKRHRVGDDVEARYKRGRKWYPGIIRTVNRDGTFDIRYKDGDTERDVEASFVRSKGSASIDSLDSDDQDGFKIGDKVEARFGGRSRWYKATIERKNHNGTYHLVYVDGDEEKAVGKQLIRHLERKVDSGERSPGGRAQDGMESNTKTENKHRVGDHIEARYKKGQKWYPGVIRGTNWNGTYDVRYNDGDEEDDVDPTFVRGTASASVDSLESAVDAAKGRSGDSFEDGDKVEARFRGRSRWSNATVERRNRDGTYYVVYSDGEEERTVGKDLIRPVNKKPSIRDAARRVVSPTESESGRKRVVVFRVGQQIEARYKRGQKWYPGVVRAANRGGTYDIRYNDGDTEYDVNATLVRSIEADGQASSDADSKGAGEYVEGDKVEARFGGRSRWFKATIQSRNRNGTYHLLYADGDEEKVVDKSLIRRLKGAVAQSSKDVDVPRPKETAPRGGRKKELRIGDQIEARYKKGQRWYPGVIRAANRDGTYDIRYEDGDVERDVEATLVRGKGEASSSSLESAAAGDFVEGDKVEARFGGRSRWFKATIQRKNRDGTYHLFYVDGDEERAVQKDLIRRVGAQAGSASGDRSPGRRVLSGATSDADSAIKTYRSGDEVEARYQRGRKWYPGAIRAVNRDGTYDIRYSDGDIERDVEAGLVRSLGAASTNSLATISSTGRAPIGGDNFVVGDQVEARFGGRSRWFKATVEKENRNGTFHLLYADGDEERHVTKDLIRRVEVSVQSGSKSPGRRVISGADSDVDRPRATSLREGDEIEARYKRGRKWFPGVVSTVNRDGTFDIRYKDGDAERSVKPPLVRAKGVASADTLLSTDGGGESFEIDEKVEARFGGRSRWFKATVQRKHRDGTYHLVYADGDEERAVERDLIRKLESAAMGRRKADSLDSLASNDGLTWRVGDKVEARFGGRSRWFKATVERNNRDGTYFLRYGDGDEERAVDKVLIRTPPAAPLVDESKTGEAPSAAVSGRSSHRVGDDVEARYRGGRKWYPGVIRGVNRDGTYDIRYKDGDTERRVEPDLVRGAGGTSVNSGSTGGDMFMVGDKVEARFGGRSRWYEASVERKNRDGTFFLRYVDGDEERNVEKSLIRFVNGGGNAKQPQSSRNDAHEDDSEVERDRSEAKYGSPGVSRSEARRPANRAQLPVVGDRVEGRFGGGARWFLGKVSRLHRDGTYDISYADGDSEARVPVRYVRLPERLGGGGSDGSDVQRHATSPNRRDVRLTGVIVGDTVEARPRGRSGWHRGDVTRVHSDGRFDIRYKDDGRLDERVDPHLVRLLDGQARGTSSSTSDSDDKHRKRDQRGRSKGRRSERGLENAGEDAKAAATRVANVLRKAGRTIEGLTRKLERRRGRGAVVWGVERNALEDVLADLGANLASREIGAIVRNCGDVDLDGCIDPAAVASLLKEARDECVSSSSRRGSIDDSGRVSHSAPRHHRAHRSSSAAHSDGSSDSGGVPVGRRGTRSMPQRRRSRSSLSSGSNDERSVRDRRKSRENSRSRDRLRNTGRKTERRAGGDGRGAVVTTSSERDGNGSSSGSIEYEDGGTKLVSKAVSKAFGKLESLAFDGSLRRAFEELTGGGRRHQVLSRSHLKRLLRSVRVKLDGPATDEMMRVLDVEGLGSCEFDGLVEAALSAPEDKEVAKVLAGTRKQVFKPSGRGGKTQESKEAKAASAAILKTMIKMEHPKASGLLRTGDMKKLLHKAGTIVSTEEARLLAERLDPDGRGKLDRGAFVVWLTSGLDLLQAESRASFQLSLLKEKAGNPVKAFTRFDRERRDAVGKSSFLAALRDLGLLLTHGQAIALATEYRADYNRFLKLCDRPRSTESDYSRSDGSDGGRHSRSRTRESPAKPMRRGDSSSDDESDRPLTSDAAEDEGVGANDTRALLGRRTREALRDLFARACSSKGDVRDTFYAACGSEEEYDKPGVGANREQTKRFMRRLKLNLEGRERAVLLDILAGLVYEENSRAGRGKRRSVSFEREASGRRRRSKRGSGRQDDTSSEEDGDRGGGVTVVLYRDVLELMLVEQESKDVSKLHGRMSKDLAKAAAKRSDKSLSCPYALALKPFSRYDTDGLGFVKVSDFKRGLEKLGVGGLSSQEKSLIVRRFDPLEEGTVNYEMFCAWLSSGLDPNRLTRKISRLMGIVTANTRGRRADRKGSNGGKSSSTTPSSHTTSGVRNVFESIDPEAEGTVSQRNMKLALTKTLGLPFTEGDLRALFRMLDKDGNGMLDYEELLALASRQASGDESGTEGGRRRGSILSRLKEKGSALIKSGSPSKKRRGSSSRERRRKGSNSDDDDDDDDEMSSGDDGKKRAGGRDDTDGDESNTDEADEGASSKRGKKKHKENRKHSGSPSKKHRLERDIMRIRASILQQRTASEGERSKKVAHAKDGDDDSLCRGPDDLFPGWVEAFEKRDRAGTGAVTEEELKAVLDEAGVRLSRDDVAKLERGFAADKEEASADAGEQMLVDYDRLARWLSKGGGLDDVLLAKVQHHLKARLSKAMDLRALFSEMANGSKKRTENKTKLSRSRLAQGLRHAGLPLDRAVVNQLVAAYSTARGGGGGGGGGGRGLSYADFHRMVHSKGLAGSAVATRVAGDGVGEARGRGVGDGGYGGGAGTLDEQIRSTLLETVERAFAFFDEDGSNSIDAGDLVNIVRALGHDPTRAEARALVRKADGDRDGVLQYEEFQEAVMPFLLERANAKRLTEGEMRALFDAIDTDQLGAIERAEFEYLFCGKLKLLTRPEADGLLSVLDRHKTGKVSWEEFVRLFELIDQPEGEGAAALNPDLKEVVTVALRKLQMGTMPDVQAQLSSFLGMPSTCRKSILAPLDSIKELTLQWILMPKLDSRGCIHLQDMSVKVTTEVAEVEANKAPPDAQVFVKTSNLADTTKKSKSNKNKLGTPPRSLAATLGFGKRDTSPPPSAVTELKGTKTRRRSAILGAGLMETTTTVMKRAQLQEVGAPTSEGSGPGAFDVGHGGVLQVELSVKHAFGIPVARDSRTSDIRQRGMRACLFYDTGNEVDRDAGERTSEYGEHFLGNTYKTLAVQHTQKEEQWLFPDSAEGERKFLVRTDFGSGGGGGKDGASHQRNRKRRFDQPSSSWTSSSGNENRDKLFLLVELTCTVQTSRDERSSDWTWEKNDRSNDNGSGNGGAVRGPLKNFRASRGFRKRGPREGRGRGSSDGEDSSEHEENGDDLQGSASEVDDESETASASDGSATKSRMRGRQNKRRARGNQRESRQRRRSTGSDNSSSHRGRKFYRRRGRSFPAFKSKTSGNTRGRNNRRARTESIPNKNSRNGSISRRKSGRRSFSGATSSSGDEEATPSSSSASNSSNSTSRGRAATRRKSRSSSRNRNRPNSKRKDNESDKADGRRGTGWRGRWSRGGGGGGGGGGDGRGRREEGKGAGKDQGGMRRRDSGDDEEEDTAREDEAVEVEMSCGWVLIPFMELVQAQEVKKVRYKLSGGTPFAKMDIDEDEVMTRRYGWRAVLKAMKIEGMQKDSEVEIKILPVSKLSKAKQEDIFRLPRNVVLSDTFVSLVRHYREYAANSLAKRSARGMGNAGFGAGSASSEPVLALFPRLAADPALMLALKNQWEIEVRKHRVGVGPKARGGERLGATLAAGLAGVGIGAVGPEQREAALLQAFESAVMCLWPAYCHIDAQRRGSGRAMGGGRIGAESYEELEGRCKRVRQILAASDSFRSDTPTNSALGGGAGGGWRGDAKTGPTQDGNVFVAFTLKEVAFDVA